MSFTTLLIVPTGVGASIGGYAGDALPVARLLAAVSDTLITHPNVLNGAMLYWPLDQTLYVEGYALDQFCRGEWGLRPVRANQVGVLLDQGLSAEQVLHHHHVIQAAQSTLGLSMGPVLTTDEPVQLNLMQARTGSSWGTVRNPGTLLRGGELLKAQGCGAVALVVRFPELGWRDYDQGQGVDPIAGLEALLSHLMVKHLQLPCAHAPALEPSPPMPVHPRTSAEQLGFTFLPCVLVGLSRAPQYVPPQLAALTVADLDAVVLPATAFGGRGVLALAGRSRPPVLIGVTENQTALSVTATSLGIKSYTVQNYWEAAGLLACLKAGLDPKRVRA